MQIRRVDHRGHELFITVERAARWIAQAWTGKFRGDGYEVALEEAGERLMGGHTLCTGLARYRLTAQGEGL